MSREKDKQKDLANLGWSLEDFGYFVPGEFGLPVEATKAQQDAFLQRVLNTSIPEPTQRPKNFLAASNNITNPQQVAAGGSTPEEAAIVRNFWEYPEEFVFSKVGEPTGIVDRTKNFAVDTLSSVFNIEDERENAVEYAWDNMLSGYGWAVDRINQLTVAGVSALPGGIAPLTWDQAGTISFGQATVTNAAQLRRQLRESGPLGEALAVSQLAVPDITGEDPLYGRKSFNLTNPIERELAFQKNTAGKWASGTSDLVFSLFFGDPLIIGGKLLKGSRIKWVDKPIITADQKALLKTQLAEDVVKIQNNDPNISAMGKFIQFATQKDANGKHVQDIGVIAEHKVVRDAARSDSLVKALWQADNFEEAALVMRYAYGDADAAVDIMARRADIAAHLGAAEQDALMKRLAFNPKARKTIVGNYQKQVTGLRKTVRELSSAHVSRFGKDVPEPPPLAAARAELRDKELLLNYAQHGTVPSILRRQVTQDEVALADKIVNDIKNRDRYLQQLIETADVEGTLIGATRGFGGVSRFGRAVEASRERRAAAAWKAQATRDKIGWQFEDVTQNNSLVNAVRVWRWLGQERPSGYMYFRGTAAIDQAREWAAQLNSVRLLSGDGVKVKVNGKEQVVGGLRKKNELLEKFYLAVGSGVDDQNLMYKTILNLETELLEEIGKAYQLPKSKLDEFIKNGQAERAELMEQIRNRMYWVDEDPATGKPVPQIAPQLESQLRDGMYLVDFAKVELMAAEATDKASLFRKASDSIATGAPARIYRGYMDNVWKPMVLFRLGYPMRTNVEGVVREAAYSASLEAFANVGKQLGYGITNPVRRKAVEAQIAKIEKDLAKPSTTRSLGGKKFQDWRKRQLEFLVERIAKEEQHADNQIDLMKNSQLQRDELDFQWKELQAHAKYVDGLRAQQNALMDDMSAMSLYWKQSGAKRRVFDGFIDDPDSGVWQNAFNNQSAFTVNALRNLSSEGTTRQMATTKMNSMMDLWNKVRTKYYVEVKPSDGDSYWDGVATTLGYFKSSTIGNMVLRGATPTQIATFLMKTEEGKDIAQFLDDSPAQPFEIKTFSDAEKYGQLMIDRLQAVAPSPELQQFVLAVTGRGGKDEQIITGADVKRFLDNDQYQPLLKPVVGNTYEALGGNKLINFYQRIIGAGWKWLATIPEDAIVRVPFYGQRHREVIQQLRGGLLQKYKNDEFIPLTEIDRAQRIAHARALKDTRKYMFTIERKTNLGSTAEYLAAFISAQQNSITTFGRLIWNDPSLIGVANLVWNAPDKMGVVDSEGNIRVGLILDLIPERVKENLGLDAMANVKFGKASFNTIMPESGFLGIVPTPSPPIEVLSSELMKNSFFGLYTVEAPNWLVGITEMLGGDKTNADSVWDLWKSFIHGGESGVSSDYASYGALLGPAYAKIAQMVLGPEASTSFGYWYQGIQRSEEIKYEARLRDKPDPEEIDAKANAFQWLRIISNLVLPVQPQYELKVAPVIEATQRLKKDDPENGEAKAFELFGETIYTLANFSVTKKVGGMTPSAESVRRVRKYDSLIRDVSSDVETLDVLGIFYSSDPDWLYDKSAYGWMLANNVPGLNEKFSYIQSPEASLASDRVSGGWIKHLKTMDRLDLMLEEAGATSYSQVPELNALRKASIEDIRLDPLFAGWYEDWDTRGSRRAEDFVIALKRGLSDEQFVKDREGDPIWMAADQYVQLRDGVLQLLSESQSTNINASVNTQIKQMWDQGRQVLKQRYNGWGTVANRFLNGDDSIGQISAGFEEGDE